MSCKRRRDVGVSEMKSGQEKGVISKDVDSSIRPTGDWSDWSVGSPPLSSQWPLDVLVTALPLTVRLGAG